MRAWMLVLIAVAAAAGWWWWRRRQATEGTGMAPGIVPGSSTVAAVAALQVQPVVIPGIKPTPMPEPANTGVIPPQIVNASTSKLAACPPGTKRAYQGTRPVCVPK